MNPPNIEAIDIVQMASARIFIFGCGQGITVSLESDWTSPSVADGVRPMPGPQPWLSDARRDRVSGKLMGCYVWQLSSERTSVSLLS